MIRILQICVGLSILGATFLWAQVDATASQPAPAFGATGDVAESANDQMAPPPPVSGRNFVTAPASSERFNYLRLGIVFNTAYTDNAQGGVNGHPISDLSYSVAPTIALDEATTRMHALLTYAPGFTFYRRDSSLNEADQNASINFTYRLSPHVTFSAQDSFQKSSNVLNQPELTATESVSGSPQAANFSIIAPIADVLRNSGNAGVAYQFARNGMVGASGTFSNLLYPNPAQVPGLYDSSSQGASAFYSLRISKMHYIGATYEYQRFASYPTYGLNETQTHSLLFFYTLYASPRFSISFFGGPEHSDTVNATAPPLGVYIPQSRQWTPSAGASVGWQGQHTGFALSYAHTISGGGGLIGAVQLDSATASVQQKILKSLTVSFGGAYAQNNLLGSPVAGGADGHSIAATASLHQEFRNHLGVQLGYTRLHQAYSGVEVISLTPDTNREFVAVSYQFSRPLGR
jgi:hypothetical protein